MATLKPYSNGPLCDNTVIGTLAVDGWAVTFGTARMGQDVLPTHPGLHYLNPVTATLKPHSNGPGYSNTVIGTLAVDGLAVRFGTAMRGLGGLHPRLCSYFSQFSWQMQDNRNDIIPSIGLLTLHGHITTVEQRTVVHGQYGNWYTGC